MVYIKFYKIGYHMLRIIFLGQDIGILEELQALCKIEMVYFQQPRLSGLKPRNIVLRSYRFRRFLLPILLKNVSFFKKWLRIIEAFKVYDFAKAHDLNIMAENRFDAEKIFARIQPLNLDLGVVANFAPIIPQAVYDSATYGFINYHPSLLPKYRGPNPFERVFLNAEAETGVTFLRITKGIDNGNILAQERISVSDTDTFGDLVVKSIKTGRQMLGRLLTSIEQGCQEEWAQDESLASYFGKLTHPERKSLNLIMQKRLKLKAQKRQGSMQKQN